MRVVCLLFVVAASLPFIFACIFSSRPRKVWTHEHTQPKVFSSVATTCVFCFLFSSLAIFLTSLPFLLFAGVVKQKFCCYKWWNGCWSCCVLCIGLMLLYAVVHQYPNKPTYIHTYINKYGCCQRKVVKPKDGGENCRWCGGGLSICMYGYMLTSLESRSYSMSERRSKIKNKEAIRQMAQAIKINMYNVQALFFGWTQIFTSKYPLKCTKLKSFFVLIVRLLHLNQKH